MSADPRERDRGKPAEEPPPVLGTWRRVYAAVLAWLALLITLFYLFERTFTP